jgi:hypothetical protein
MTREIKAKKRFRKIWLAPTWQELQDCDYMMEFHSGEIYRMTKEDIERSRNAE